MKPTNLNPLFINLVCSYAHLIGTQEQSKKEFLENIKKTYCLSNPRNLLFYSSAEKSDFDTVRIDRVKEQILFNH